MSRWPRSIASALLAVGALVGAAPRASADDSPGRTSSLAWVRMPGAESCIDGRALSQAVERRLGRVAFVAPSRGEVAIEARIERLHDPDGWHATITVFDDTGARTGFRELQTDRAECRAIDDELELVIALLIDPSAALAPPISPGTPAPPSISPVTPAPLAFSPIASPSAAAPQSLQCPPPPPAPREPWRVGIAAGPIVGFGLLPSAVGVGLAMRAHLVPPRGPSFELGGSVWADNTVPIGTGDRTFSLAYGWLSVCPVDLALGATTLVACLGAHVGSLRVGGIGVPGKYYQEQLLLDVAVDAGVRRRFVGPLFGRLGLGIAVPTRRDRFYFTDAAAARHEVFQASPVTGLADLALGLELP
jgi:hypothetical protein